ncbi:hypothetical protein GYMLUDRAFT_44468 [Collybiopsis luxurians FD-317 M1]|uniref:F-box domain-containing protein n=1 Tax=Collybiopsis luxurians FD-317 M1 TaxID=944289 RepID=A0A0D0CLT0_9AGAR|nr:hypothetical protein GYMLUDRAFT_44468 [Collybiopsis luxurians FD-317 M1]
MASETQLHLHQSRIEGPVYLEPNEVAFLRRQILEGELQLMAFESRTNEGSAPAETSFESESKLVELSLLRNLLSPIRRIPVEVLATIFELICWSPHFPPTYGVMRSASIISSVCIAWRNTAHATPHIWTKLCLSRSWHPKAFIGDVAWIKVWLSRSRGLPLELFLDLQHVNTRNEVPEYKLTQFVEHVAGFSCQITWFAFSGDSKLFLPLFRLPPSSFPRLEGIYMDILPVRALAYLFPNKVQAFLDSPTLQHVQITDSADGSLLESLALPEGQLANLVIHGQRLFASRALYSDVLHRCKSLVNLTIHLPTFNAPGQHYHFIGFDENHSLVLPSLKFLHTSCHPVTGNGVNILRCLVAPRLEILVLKWRGQIYRDLSMDVSRFQDCSAARLLSLDLVGFTAGPGEHSYRLTECLFAILPLFFTVKAFKFCYMLYDVDLLLQAMIYREKRPVLLPNLKHFELTQLPSPNTSQEGVPLSSTLHLSSVILSRYPQGETDDTLPAKLQSVLLHGQRFKEHVESIRQTAPGLRLHYCENYHVHPSQL